LKQKGDALRQKRDEAIRRAHSEGLPMTVIGEIIGISSQRVSQIVRS